MPNNAWSIPLNSISHPTKVSRGASLWSIVRNRISDIISKKPTLNVCGDGANPYYDIMWDEILRNSKWNHILGVSLDEMLREHANPFSKYYEETDELIDWLNRDLDNDNDTVLLEEEIDILECREEYVSDYVDDDDGFSTDEEEFITDFQFP